MTVKDKINKNLSSKEHVLFTLDYAWQHQRPIHVQFSKNSSKKTIKGKIFQIDNGLLYIKTPQKITRVDIDDILDINAA